MTDPEPKASDFTHLPVSVPNGILVFPIGPAEQVPQCTGSTTRRRCNAGLYHGQWEEWVVEGLGYVNAADGCETDPDIFLRQRCERHLNESASAADPDWELFTPQRFPCLVDPHRNIWTPEKMIVTPRRQMEPPQPAPAAPTPHAGPAAARQRPDVPTALYWHYDANATLLYIGITDGLVGRGKAHAARSSWVQFAKTSKSEWHPNRREAEDAEKKAIEAERPLFNVTHDDTPEARARLVAYLVQHDRLDLLAPAVSRG